MNLIILSLASDSYFRLFSYFKKLCAQFLLQFSIECYAYFMVSNLKWSSTSWVNIIITSWTTLMVLEMRIQLYKKEKCTPKILSIIDCHKSFICNCDIFDISLSCDVLELLSFANLLVHFLFFISDTELWTYDWL